MRSAVSMQAEGAISHYDVHVVVANLLETRKDRVWLVRRAVSSPGDGTPADSRSDSDGRLDGKNSPSESDDSPSAASRDAARRRQEQSQFSTVGRTSKVSVQVIDRPAADSCIEIQLVSRVARLHSSYLQSMNQSLLRSLMASMSASGK